RETPAPELTAIVDATAATLLELFREEVIVEADEDGYREALAPQPPRTLCRQALLNVIGPEWTDPELGPLPDGQSGDVEVWGELADNLFPYVLWDYEFDDEDMYADREPTFGSFLKETMNIHPDYFTATA